MQKALPISLSLVALLSITHAKELTLQPLDVTSTAIATDELSATSAIEVYTQEDIQDSHAKSVYEFLNAQSSVISMPSYGNSFSQLIDMRGYGLSGGNQNTVINLNGRKLNNIDNLPQFLASIPVDSITKIEILKSSGIVTNGDGANAGVINIITKAQNHTNVGLVIGTYSTISGTLNSGHIDDEIEVSLNGEVSNFGGLRTVNLEGDKEMNKLRTGDISLAYKAIEDLELRLGAAATRSEVLYGGTMTQKEYFDNPAQQGTTYSSWFDIWVPSNSVKQKFDTNNYNAGFTYEISDALSFRADASMEDKKSDYVPSYGPSYYDYGSANIALDYESDVLALTFGFDQFNGQRDQGVNQTNKDNLAGYLMANFYLDALSLTAGYRYEQISYQHKDNTVDIKDDDTYHGAELGVNYKLDKENSLFVNYAHAYQAPSIDMFFTTSYGPPPTFTPVTTFNQLIDTMKSDSITLGYNSITNTNKLKVSAFYIQLKDEIYLDKSFGGFGTNTNIDKSHKYGLDIYNRALLGEEFALTFNYNYVQAIIDEEKAQNGDDYDGNKLPGVSDHNVKLTLDYMPNKHAKIALTQVYRSEAYAADDFANNFQQKQKAYKSTDLVMSYSQPKYEVFAKIENLFNQKNGLWIKDDAIYPVNYTTTAIAGLTLKY